MNYEEIKAEAKEMNKSVTELLALSSNNDPFYVGSPGQLEKAKWFAMVYEKMGKPGEMKKVIERATAPYFDTEAWNKAIDLNIKIQRKVREYLVGKIDNVLEDLDLEEFEDQEIEKEELYDDNDEEWLFDSDLDYFDQIENYKAHKS